MPDPFRWMWPARLPQPADVAGPVHDGDTVWLELDRGINFDRTIMAFRLRNVFMPELKQPGGAACQAYLFGLLTVSPGKWPLVVETFRTKGGRDITTLDRFVAEITIGALSVNAELRRFLGEHPEWGGGVGG